MSALDLTVEEKIRLACVEAAVVRVSEVDTPVGTVIRRACALVEEYVRSGRVVR